MEKLIFNEVFRALNKSRVRYVVAGGFAVNLHGYIRYTGDLDLIVDLEEKNLAKFFDALKGAGYVPKGPVTKDQFMDEKERKDWHENKNMVVFSFVELKPPLKLVDMFIDLPISFKEVLKDSLEDRIGGIKIRFLSIKHLIKLKLLASRFKDLQDIAQLRAIEKGL